MLTLEQNRTEQNRTEQNRTVRKDGGLGIFKISDLFDVSTSKSTDKNKLIFVSKEQGIQFIWRTSVNNWIQGYAQKLNYEPNSKNTFSVVQIGENVCQFRESDWYASQNIFLLIPKKDQAEKLVKNRLYIISIINKSLTKFSGWYVSYPTLDSLKNSVLKIPLFDWQIDFDFMETFIRAIKKLVIKDLVLWNERKLQTYRQVIN